jgi:hypothetical protein
MFEVLSEPLSSEKHYSQVIVTWKFTLSPSALSLGREAESRLTMTMAQMTGGVLSDAIMQIAHMHA